MKRFSIFLVTILVLYSVYHDLMQGTIPISTSLPDTSTPTVSDSTEESEPSYFEKKVERGDTVLSIIETSLDGPIPVSIDTVVQDFSQLNDGLRPEHIKYGEHYRFPNYSEE